MNSYNDFKKDFETQDPETNRFYFDLTHASNLSGNKLNGAYKINKKEYSVYETWIHLKDYHIERMENLNSYNEKLDYLNRIIPQMNKERLKHKERFKIHLGIPDETLNEMNNEIKEVIEVFEWHKKDIERYLSTHQISNTTAHTLDLYDSTENDTMETNNPFIEEDIIIAETEQLKKEISEYLDLLKHPTETGVYFIENKIENIKKGIEFAKIKENRNHFPKEDGWTYDEMKNYKGVIANQLANLRIQLKATERYRDEIKKQATAEQKESTAQPEHWRSLIKTDLHNRLSEIEGKIESKIANWKKRGDLIECAAFCELLYDKLYFNKELKLKTKLNRKAINSFALSKYGTDIENQLNAGEKKEARNNHKNLLSKYFS